MMSFINKWKGGRGELLANCYDGHFRTFIFIEKKRSGGNRNSALRQLTSHLFVLKPLMLM